MYNVQNYSVNHTRSLKNERTTDLLVGVQSSGHDPAEDVERGRVLGRVLFRHVNHQTTVLLNYARLFNEFSLKIISNCVKIPARLIR